MRSNIDELTKRFNDKRTSYETSHSSTDIAPVSDTINCANLDRPTYKGRRMTKRDIRGIEANTRSKILSTMTEEVKNLIEQYNITASEFEDVIQIASNDPRDLFVSTADKTLLPQLKATFCLSAETPKEFFEGEQFMKSVDSLVKREYKGVGNESTPESRTNNFAICLLGCITESIKEIGKRKPAHIKRTNDDPGVGNSWVDTVSSGNSAAENMKKNGR